MNKKDAILITGAGGFIGKNLVSELRLQGFENLLLFDLESSEEELLDYCKKASFVFHLAGINRPQDPKEFYIGNSDFTQHLLDTLKTVNSSAGIAVTSSIQAELENDYGKSKALCEEAVFDYGEKNNLSVFVFRLAGVFGKWCRPNYNSVVATFCHNTARDIPLTINNPENVVRLCYIDDVAALLCSLLSDSPMMSSRKPLQVSLIYEITLGELANTIKSFKKSRSTAFVPDIKSELSAKLYATYTSYLPKNETAYKLKNNVDERGYLTEFLKSEKFGQLFTSVTKPGVTRGNHWHHTKTEKFFAIYGTAKIKIRDIYQDEITEFEVCGEEPTVVDIPTGCTHNITNIGEGDLVTIFWSSELYNPQKPDTHFLEV